MSQPVPVRAPLQVRWRDLDALGHVNNAVYITYFEQARLAYMAALAGNSPPIDERTPLPRDFQFILAQVSCDFRSPATLGDRLLAEIWVSSVGRKSFAFQYRISDEESGRLVAEGASTQVWYDYRTGETRLVPQEIIPRMEQLQRAPIPRR